MWKFNPFTGELDYYEISGTGATGATGPVGPTGGIGDSNGYFPQGW
jgi:hypothetical protein